MKYVALTLSTVATVLLVLALAGIANQIRSNGQRLPPLQNAMSPLTSQQLSDQNDVNQALHDLGQFPAARFIGAAGSDRPAEAPPARWTVADGSIFAVSPQVKKDPAPAKRQADYRGQAINPLPLPRVSVIMQSGAEGKAMVNGNLVRVGDVVDNDMVVKSIDINAVTFASGNELLEVRMPLERLRVLGAFPRSAKGN